MFEVAVSHSRGRVDERHRLSRARLERFLARAEPAEVCLEACSSAHHRGRVFEGLGHRVSLLHPGDITRYREGNKTDRADAKALLEAARNTAIDPVPLKSVEQQAIAALHRLRQGYLRTRTARINAVRDHLRESGVTILGRARHVVARARVALDDRVVPDYLRGALQVVLAEIEEPRHKADTLRRELSASRPATTRPAIVVASVAPPNAATAP